MSARRLLQASPHVTLAVVESRDRVGGRCYLDHGAGYVDSRHYAVRGTCAELGLTMYDVHDEGQCFIDAGPWNKRTYTGANIPSGQSMRTVLALGRVINSIEVSTSRAVPDPEDVTSLSSSARELDKYSVLDYFRLRTSDSEALATLRLALLPVFGAEPERISLLYFLFYCRAAGGIGRLLCVSNGAQQKRIAQGGFDELCKRLAAELPNGALRLGSSLVALRRRSSSSSADDRHHTTTSSPSFVEVELSSGLCLHARCVILAVQPSMWDRVSCSPALPPAKLALSRAFKGTSKYAKARLRFKSCWWRARGWSGQLVSAKGPATYFLDDVKKTKKKKKEDDEDEDEDEDDFGLVAFIVDWPASEAWRAADRQERMTLLAAQLFAALGDARAETELCDYKDWDWTADLQFTDGCVPVLAPGALQSGWASASAPCWDGLLRFAGTETAGEGMGYVQGALRAGRRAACEALEQLGLSKEAKASREKDEREKDEGGVGVCDKNSRGWLENTLLGRQISAAALRNRRAATTATATATSSSSGS